jgi:hypothetical protein
MKHIFKFDDMRPLKKSVAQVSKPAVSPTSKSATRGHDRKLADLEIRDTADWEVCATSKGQSRRVKGKMTLKD